jgi:hypothetical protein
MATTPTGAGGSPPPDPDAFQILTQVAAVKFLITGVQPPSRVYVGLNDMLRIDLLTGSLPQTVRVVGRLLRVDGQIVPIEHDCVITSNGAIQSFVFQEAEGFLLSVTLTPTVPFGATTLIYAQVGLQRSATGGLVFFDVLTAGYCESTRPLAWPGYPAARPQDGHGAILSLAGSVPGAGAEASVQVPNNARWRVFGAAVSITASAAVANRLPRLRYGGPGALMSQRLLFSPNVLVTAGQTVEIEWANCGPAQAQQDSISPIYLAAIPDLWLNAGDNLSTSTENLQAGDQYTALCVAFEQWADPQ